MERKKIINKYSEWIIYILFFVGIVFHPIEKFQNLMICLTPYTLLITTLILIINLWLDNNKLFLWFIPIVLLTLIIEIIGVKTLLVFGNYNYGSTLGFKVLDVPLIIGFNWALIILGSIQIVQKYISNKIFIMIFSSVFTVLFDIILEPVAVKLNYWNWYQNIIPVQNYIAWFLISFFCVFIYSKIKIELKTDLPLKYFLVQLIFFFSLLVSI